jgi:hypothetical protein
MATAARRNVGVLAQRFFSPEESFPIEAREMLSRAGDNQISF